MNRDSLKTLFYPGEPGGEKNDLHRAPIRHDLTSVHTLGTPQNSPWTRPGSLLYRGGAPVCLSACGPACRAAAQAQNAQADGPKGGQRQAQRRSHRHDA
jgi:hypothetical protein